MVIELKEYLVGNEKNISEYLRGERDAEKKIVDFFSAAEGVDDIEQQVMVQVECSLEVIRNDIPNSRRKLDQNPTYYHGMRTVFERYLEENNNDN